MKNPMGQQQDVIEIRVPRLNTNEDKVMVDTVEVSEGEQAEAGQVLFVVESSKASSEITAPCAGYIRALNMEEGSHAEVGACLCLITPEIDTPLPASKQKQAAGTEKPRSTAGARLKARKHRKQSAQSVQQGERPQPIDGTTLPWVKEARQCIQTLTDGATVKLDAAGLQSAQVHLGDGSFIGEGATICARRIYLSQGASIGANCHIEADTVFLGSFAKIGRGTRMVSGELIFADGAVVCEEVIVDLAGGRHEDSRLLMGPACLVGSRACLNTCREVILDEISAVSPGAMLFTHGFWQSVLLNYAASFGPVHLASNAWVGAGCQVTPGVIVGEGAIAMSNSTLVESVPAHTMVAGIPAKPVKSGLGQRMTPPEQHIHLLRIMAELVGQLVFKGCTVSGDPNHLQVKTPEPQEALIRVIQPGETLSKVAPNTIVLGWHLPLLGTEHPVFDLGTDQFAGKANRLSIEIRNFLRRRGIRFQPHGWDSGYAKGL